MFQPAGPDLMGKRPGSATIRAARVGRACREPLPGAAAPPLPENATKCVFLPMCHQTCLPYDAQQSMSISRRSTMDASRFDHLVRTWAEAGSRRPLLGVLAGGIAGLAGLTEAAGKRKKKITLCLNGQTITVPKKKKNSYLGQGATAGKCPPCVRRCGGKTCGPDGCGGSCGSCKGDKTCQGGTCACRAGEIECPANACLPGNSVCCTDLDCAQYPGRHCLNGQCVVWQGTCPVGADTCISPQACSGSCACYQSTEGETRCGMSLGIHPDCERCVTSADCVAQFPEFPGVFCKQGEGNSCGCPGVCLQPCLTP